MKKWLIIGLAVVLLGATLAGLTYRENQKLQRQKAEGKFEPTQTFEDESLGVQFSMHASYKEKPAPTPLTKSFERSRPQVFLTVKYERGLSGPANLSRRSLVDHIQAEIDQFFPVRYGKSYKAISLNKRDVADKKSVEHVFTYNDKDGAVVKARLVAVPWDSDSAYYFISQGHERLYDRINSDLNVVLDSLSLTGAKQK